MKSFFYFAICHAFNSRPFWRLTVWSILLFAFAAGFYIWCHGMVEGNAQVELNRQARKGFERLRLRVGQKRFTKSEIDAAVRAELAKIAGLENVDAMPYRKGILSLRDQATDINENRKFRTVGNEPTLYERLGLRSGDESAGAEPFVGEHHEGVFVSSRLVEQLGKGVPEHVLVLHPNGSKYIPVAVVGVFEDEFSDPQDVGYDFIFHDQFDNYLARDEYDSNGKYNPIRTEFFIVGEFEVLEQLEVDLKEVCKQYLDGKLLYNLNDFSFGHEKGLKQDKFEAIRLYTVEKGYVISRDQVTQLCAQLLKSHPHLKSKIEIQYPHRNVDSAHDLVELFFEDDWQMIDASEQLLNHDIGRLHDVARINAIRDLRKTATAKQEMLDTCMVALAIVLSLVMVVIQKLRLNEMAGEIGMLKAMGVSRTVLFFSLVVQNLAILGASVVLGIVVGFVFGFANSWVGGNGFSGFAFTGQTLGTLLLLLFLAIAVNNVFFTPRFLGKSPSELMRLD